MGCLGGCLANFMVGCTFALLKITFDIFVRVLRLLNPRRVVAVVLALVVAGFLFPAVEGMGIRSDPKQFAMLTLVTIAGIVFIAARKEQIAEFITRVFGWAGFTRVSGTARSVVRRELQKRGLISDYTEHVIELALEISPGDYRHVEMRGRDIVGSVEDGDMIEVSGRVDSHNIMHASKIVNHSRHCVIITRWV